jgi:tetratricopeptide (TPR) repeat protein
MKKIDTGCTKAICLLFISHCLFLISYSQWYNPEKVNKKAAEVYGKAYQDAQNEQYPAAMEKIARALEIDPNFVDAWLTRAGIYANMKKYDSSVADFEKGLQLDSVYAADYYLPYSISLAGIGQFQRSLDAVNIFLKNKKLNERSLKAANYRKGVYEFALEYEKKHPSKNYVFAPQNLGDSVNSIYPEYYPALTIDGKKLIFTRRVERDEDFYECELKDGSW